MKTFKDLVNEVAQPLSQGEKNFKALHGSVEAINRNMVPGITDQDHIFKGNPRREDPQTASYEDQSDSEAQYDKNLKTSVSDVEEDYKPPEKDIDSHFKKQSQKMQDAINLHLRKGNSYWDSYRKAKVHVKEEYELEEAMKKSDVIGALKQHQTKAIDTRAKQFDADVELARASKFGSSKEKEKARKESDKISGTAHYHSVQTNRARQLISRMKGEPGDHAKNAKVNSKLAKLVKKNIPEELDLNEKHLTPAEMKKREEIAKAMERKNPGMDKSKKMAIATAQAKRVAEEKESFEDIMKKSDEKTKKKYKNWKPPYPVQDKSKILRYSSDLKKSVKEDYDMDYEGEMAKAELNAVADKAAILADMLDRDTQLEAWLQSKITKAKYMIDSVYDYMMYSEPNVNPEPENQSSAMATNYGSFLNRMGESLEEGVVDVFAKERNDNSAKLQDWSKAKLDKHRKIPHGSHSRKDIEDEHKRRIRTSEYEMRSKAPVKEEVEQIDEGMPSSVIKHKQNISHLNDKEFAQKYSKEKYSDEQLRSMAWRHGLGGPGKPGHDTYVRRREKGLKEELELAEARRGRPRKDGSKPEGDEEGGREHIVMQLRKVVNLRGQKPVEFNDNSKHDISVEHAKKALAKHDSMHKAADKQAYAEKLAKSHGSFKSAVSEAVDPTTMKSDRGDIKSFVRQDATGKFVVGKRREGRKELDVDAKMNEELKGAQHKIDANKNGKIDSQDFKMLKGKKKVEEELKGNQHKIDANKNGKVDAVDFKILKHRKKMLESLKVNMAQDSVDKIKKDPLASKEKIVLPPTQGNKPVGGEDQVHTGKYSVAEETTLNSLYESLSDKNKARFEEKMQTEEGIEELLAFAQEQGF